VILGNSTEDGGGMYHGGEFFTMTGGKITGNTAIFGGGVYVPTNFEFNWQGGVVSDNTTTNKAITYTQMIMVTVLVWWQWWGSNGGNGGVSFMVDGFSLRDIVFICVGITIVVVGVVAAVLLFTVKKQSDYTKEKIS